MLPDPLPPQPAGERQMTGVVFKIHNWDRYEDIAINPSKILPTDPLTNDSKSGQVWIKLYQVMEVRLEIANLDSGVKSPGRPNITLPSPELGEREAAVVFAFSAPKLQKGSWAL